MATFEKLVQGRYVVVRAEGVHGQVSAEATGKEREHVSEPGRIGPDAE